MKKVCIFSGKRGGFGAYLPLMKALEKDPAFGLQIVLTDMHVSKEFGETAEEARKFFPDSEIKFIRMKTGRGDSPVIRSENLGFLLQKLPAVLNDLKPDFLMVHADRGEHLLAAFAALNLGNIAVCHTQGGEVSGNIDDIQRHAITKLAHLHFPETKEAAERIRNLGEEKWRIHPVGSLYIDRITEKNYTPNREVRKKIGLSDREEYFLIIFHPDTFQSRDKNHRDARNIFEAIKSFGKRSIIIYPCSDPGYEGIIKAVKEIEKDKIFLVFKNIENFDFLGLMAEAEAIIGNSSSALVEAPYFQLPAVNIGGRQQGRDREENVIDAAPDYRSICGAIKFVLTNKQFGARLSKCGYRLGDGNASSRIVKILKSASINDKLLKKKATF